MSQQKPINIREIEQSILKNYESIPLFETLRSVRGIKCLFARLLAPSSHSPYFSSRNHEDWRPSRFQFAFTNEDSAAVFCIGGPRQMQLIWEIEDFEKRVETAEGWVASLRAGKIPMDSFKHDVAGTDLPASSMNISASPPVPLQLLQELLQHLPDFFEMYEESSTAVLKSRGISTSGSSLTVKKLLQHMDAPLLPETLRWDLPTGRFWNPPDDVYNRTRVPDHELDDW